jgi:hypothetical protein
MERLIMCCRYNKIGNAGVLQAVEKSKGRRKGIFFK